MTQIRQSRILSAFAQNSVAAHTLLDVKTAIERHEDLDERTRADLRSALNSIAKLHLLACEPGLDGPLTRFTVAPKSLVRFFNRNAAMQQGYTAAHWNNLKSRVRKAVHLSGLTSQAKHAGIPEEWTKLWQKLDLRRDRVTFGCFVKFCATKDIAPDNVTSETFLEFANHLKETFSRSRPREAMLAAAKLWNLMSEVPSVSLPRFTNRYALALDELPASVVAEINTLENKWRNPEILQGRRALRPKTINGRLATLRRLATAHLITSGGSNTAFTSLKELLEERALENVIAFYQVRIQSRSGLPLTEANHARSQRLALDIHLLLHVARDLNVTDVTTLKMLRLYSRALYLSHKGLAPKNLEVLKLLDNEELFFRLLTLPEKIFKRLSRKTQLNRADAVKMQIALAVAFLIRFPVRAGNLASTHIELHLRPKSPSTGKIQLRYPEQEVKNSSEIHFEAQPDFVKMLEVYSDRARPLLLGKVKSLFLFPNQTGGHKRSDMLGNQISQFIKRELGIRVSPHQFRHLCAQSLLDADSRNAEVARRILGHNSINTTMRYYGTVRMSKAAEAWDRTRTEIGKRHEKSRESKAKGRAR